MRTKYYRKKNDLIIDMKYHTDQFTTVFCKKNNYYLLSYVYIG